MKNATQQENISQTGNPRNENARNFMVRQNWVSNIKRLALTIVKQIARVNFLRGGVKCEISAEQQPQKNRWNSIS